MGQWTKEERQKLPEPWSPPGERKRAPEGAEYGLRVRLLDVDPLDQSHSTEIHVEKWQQGRLVAEEKRRISIRGYSRDELLFMIERAGFTDIAVRGGYADEEPTADHDILVFSTRR